MWPAVAVEPKSQDRRPICGFRFRRLAITTRAAGSEDQSPIALLNILLEASIGPTSNKGRIIGQGNFAEAKAMLKKAGNAIARSQRIVLHFSKCFFSALFIRLPFLLFGRVGYLSNYTSKAKFLFNLTPRPANCKRQSKSAAQDRP